MAFVGWQCMLFGIKDGEIVVEVQVPISMYTALGLPWKSVAQNVTPKVARSIMDTVKWQSDADVDGWQIECQELHRRR